MNIDNMKRLKTYLELEGQKFNYNTYLGEAAEQPDDFNDEEDEDLMDFTPPTTAALLDFYNGKCGAVGCLAGMAVAIAVAEDGLVAQRSPLGGEIPIDIHTSAQQWLGLTGEEAHALFLGVEMADRYETFGFADSGQALEGATPLDAAKLLQILIDEEAANG